MAVILPIVPSVARFAVSGTWLGQPFTNVFHGQYSNVPGDGATMNSICQAVQTAYHNSFGAIQGNDLTVHQTVGVDLASRTGATGSFTLDQAGGGVASTIQSVAIAVCCSWHINDRYRGGHPRSYLPGVIAGDIANGRLLNAGGLAKWKNAAAGFLTNFNAMTAGASSWKMVCVRYYSQHQLLPNPLVRLIDTSTVHQRIDSQRRRLGKELA